jgi:nicotinate-nucleotide adenylyltransferase
MTQASITQDSAGGTLRLGIFGGTFDPPHLGHLIIAQEVAVRLGLDRVLFIPAGVPPHKQGHAITPAHHRRAMVERAIAGDPRFALSLVELERAGPSYTVDTLAQLQAEYGATAQIILQLILILGGDMVYDIGGWHNTAGIVARVTRIAAVQRPGFTFDAAVLARLAAQVPGLDAAITPVDVPQIGISSSLIRERLARHLPITYLVPDAVVAYIQDHGLYQPMAEGGAR